MLNRRRRDKKIRNLKERSAGGNCAKYPHKFLEHIVGTICKNKAMAKADMGIMPIPETSLGDGVFVFFQQKTEPNDLEWPPPEFDEMREFMAEHDMEEIASGVHPRIAATLIRGDQKILLSHLEHRFKLKRRAEN
jgi:hypothetical protein